ncbi:hypothetical protein LOTGIDRAFT_230691 [Lottia gigantea]|uniref:Tyr recombinase domain-containing protein n=1 Tax=Lottia gigantea TaxID=225164 RepID=V4AVP1_LOTGI|nr:hypothetical protein LOTGIDRAFT_230691 [Lottia gigantea]ESP01413.1 hypothetical protein LOTGIDRAFT_230691 [Lottia gigantea]
MASWQFILVGVLAAVTISSARDCTYNDQTFADGSKFKLPSSGNCIEFTCTNGGFRATTKECEQGSSCFPLGHEIVNDCRKTVCQEGDDNSIAFINTEIMGIHLLQRTVKRMCQKVGFQVNFTNHSLRATAATRLYVAGVDEQLIVEKTGHRSSVVRTYKRTSDIQQVDLSGILRGEKKAKLAVIDQDSQDIRNHQTENNPQGLQREINIQSSDISTEPLRRNCKHIYLLFR